jgi:dipeptidyl aminopeptidase/acylaminoacyl peptidase
LETATGQRLLRWLTGDPSVDAVTFAPDGRTVAAATSSAGGARPFVRLFDADTGEELRRFATGRDGAIRSLAFSPDGRRLATTCTAEGQTLVWDVAEVVGRKLPAGEGLTAARLKELWDDLAGEASRAHAAVITLARAPDAAARFLSDRLPERPRDPRPDAARLARLFADLDDDDFAAREKATAALKELREPAAPALRARLRGGKLSVEAESRVRRLLDGLPEDEGPPPEVLRWLRATEALERAGGAEARRVLETLAADAGPVAEQARASLARLAK